MDANRRIALTTGILFIIATAASLLGTAMERSLLTGSGYLTQIADHLTRISTGGLFEFIAAGTSVGIAISLYPLLKRSSETLALAAVVFRTIEAVMYTVAAVCMLSLPSVAQRFLGAETADRARFEDLGNALIHVREEATLAGVIAFVFGGLMYYAVFYRSGLIPRWLSGWGIAAEVLMFIACLSSLFSRHPVTSYVILVLPIAVQEMVLALWLIVRGFRSPTHEAETVARLTAA